MVAEPEHGATWLEVAGDVPIFVVGGLATPDEQHEVFLVTAGYRDGLFSSRRGKDNIRAECPE